MRTGWDARRSNLSLARTLFGAGRLAALTDGQLLERFATGDRAASEPAFAALVERHGSMVYHTCRAIIRDDHEAQDAFQATFLILARKGRSLWVRDSLAPWLHRVACRVATRSRRDLDRRIRAERAAVRSRQAESTTPVDLERIQRLLHEELNRLPERFRLPVILCDLHALSHELAARQVGCPVGTIKSRLARGRRKLRDRLARRGLGSILVPFEFGDIAEPLVAGLIDQSTQSALWVLTRGTIGCSPTVSVLDLAGLNTRIFAMLKLATFLFAGALIVGGIVHAVGIPPSQEPSNPITKVDAPRKTSERGVVSDNAGIAPGQDDLNAIQGTWIRVSTDGRQLTRSVMLTVERSKPRPDDQIPEGAALFDFRWGKSGQPSRTLINPTRQPKQLIFPILSERNTKLGTCPGIYQLENDVLTIRFSTENGPPANFQLGPRFGETLDVYMRVYPTHPTNSPASTRTGPK